ncbi:hypothetical protein LEMA_P106600.1 [Plenodomus lingam JN3]|uniref:Zn(2)-C6 fungal-type domain-containing protein n=1 Tax=Leptosphaeria maculans (strain JN3 / isolate v23.1.3 / race Av1-4-5-6-7-8) TaxID=985895 RepID=E5A173_LEPMJ|nr:hypothetical protein LEMA_P106600.1 [Plenodomus lingam JN3]CBX97529.1 hypothetical protein LEMA_P106600.1 [Plenodomus lingam JN3]
MAKGKELPYYLGWLPMDHELAILTSADQRPRKRRAITACVRCRTSKVRCDGRQPCQRCERNNTACLFHDAVKDPITLRIENLEQEVSILRQQSSRFACNGSSVSSTVPRSAMHPFSPWKMPGQDDLSNAVQSGLVSQDQAIFWYRSFFAASQYLVPIFCEQRDTFDSVFSRSCFLFDTLTSIGCRAEEGFDSLIHRQLQSRVRDHLTRLIVASGTPTIEDVQAMTVMAAYSENAFVLIALALRFAHQLHLHHAVDRLMALEVVTGSEPTCTETQELYRRSRIWHGICNLELFFSLDGGKLPSMTLDTSSRKIRRLLTHPERTYVDVRLLSQIELNILRTDAYSKIAQAGDDLHIKSIVQDSTTELSLWLREWTDVAASEPDPQPSAMARQNLLIQQEWALMTLNLKAVAASGIENIAFMTDFQRDHVLRAKEAAKRHLHYMLRGDASLSSSEADQASTYLSMFKWTLDYVWAKCAVSVLLALKLAILLRDPVATVLSLLHDAHRVLEELKTVTVGHIAYFQILQASVEKCEAALKDYNSEHNACSETSIPRIGESGSAEDAFQGYVPHEFIFEWDFPGLNLKHMPLGWQDLFVNIDGLF